jgi:hypothetical protein
VVDRVAGLWVRCALTCAVICVPVEALVAYAADLALAPACVVTPLLILRTCAWVHAVAAAILLNPYLLGSTSLWQALAGAVRDIQPEATIALHHLAW